MWSLLYVLVSSFGDVSPVCSLYFKFGVGCCAATILEIDAHLVSHLFSSYLSNCDIYFPFWLYERDLPFDCSSSCSLLFYYLFF